MWIIIDLTNFVGEPINNLNMKTIQVFLVIIMTLLFPVVTSADSKDRPKTSTKSKEVILTPIKTAHNRPNAPARIFIHCAYSDSEIEFTLPDGVVSVSVIIYNEEENLADIVTPENPVMDISGLTGECTIECTADTGTTFYGMLEL